MDLNGWWNGGQSAGELGVGNPGSYGVQNTQASMYGGGGGAKDWLGLGDMSLSSDGLGSSLQGLSGVGNFGLGIANYFSARDLNKKKMKFAYEQLADARLTNATNNAREDDRLARKGSISGVSGQSSRTNELSDRVYENA